MLITRSFTNEEVAERLEDMRAHLSTAPTTPEHGGLIAEVCRRLRGQLPSGSDNHNELIIKMGEALVQLHADHPTDHAGAAVEAYDDWCEQFVHEIKAARRSAAASIGSPGEREGDR